MRDPISWLRERHGRRGVVLFTLAAVWIIMGLSVLTYAPPPGAIITRFNLSVLDHGSWSVMWFGSGIGAGIAAWRRRRDRSRTDTAGWVLAVIPPMVWSVFYAWSWLWWLSTDATTFTAGAPRAWVGVATWALIAGLIRTIAGWDDVLDHETDPRDRDGGRS